MSRDLFVRTKAPCRRQQGGGCSGPNHVTPQCYTYTIYRVNLPEILRGVISSLNMPRLLSLEHEPRVSYMLPATCYMLHAPAPAFS